MVSLFHWCRYLVNALVQETQPGKPEDAVCRNSCLTDLLQESLGGNAKLTVICNVSPDNKYATVTSFRLLFTDLAKMLILMKLCLKYLVSFSLLLNAEILVKY